MGKNLRQRLINDKKKLHKETEDLKINKQAEMKSTITEIKNSLARLDSRFEIAKVSKLEDGSIESI